MVYKYINEMLANSCITGSYDRTCRLWNVDAAIETAVLQGHENAVFSVAFNYPKWYDACASLMNYKVKGCSEKFD